MSHPIYLDYAATTPLDPRVLEAMLPYLSQPAYSANPAAEHALGAKAKTAIDEARAEVAALINATPAEIIWTSGATEANNLALKGIAQLYQQRGRHIVTTKIEHPSVLACCEYLEKQGFQISYLNVTSDGLIDFADFKAALRPDTILVSVLHLHNELGVMRNIQAIAEETAQRGILCHVDAAQSAGKIPLDVAKTPVDLISLCAHKCYGPKGVGALFLRRQPRVKVAAQIHGGGQEHGLRSGTLATHQIAGMGAAFKIAAAELTHDYQHTAKLAQQLWTALKDVPGIVRHGADATLYPGIMNIRFAGISARTLLQSVPQLAISRGSACHGKGTEPSTTLRALGLTRDEADSAIRISFGRFTTAAEIELAANALKQAVFNHSC